jgi:hypothetical protein
MPWWIPFTIAVVGWYFTARQNAKNSTRSLINQEIKEARAKLNELIVSCSKDDCSFPLKEMGENFIKMQTYITSIQELDNLYRIYHSISFMRIKFLSALWTAVNQLLEHENLKDVREFLKKWLLPQSDSTADYFATFDVNVHISDIRKALTIDKEDMHEHDRLGELNLQYKKICLAYKFVS